MRVPRTSKDRARWKEGMEGAVEVSEAEATAAGGVEEDSDEDGDEDGPDDPVGVVAGEVSVSVDAAVEECNTLTASP